MASIQRSEQVDRGDTAVNQAKVNGIELAYEDAGTGEPAIFIHGAFIAGAFQPMLSAASLRDRYRLIHYHRRGYGRSSRVAGPITVSEQAADCLALLRHLELERVHVVGHSYGGAIALQVAMDVPDVVHSLALLEPALAVGQSGDDYQRSLLRATERFRKEDREVVLDAFLQARWQGYRDALERAIPGAFALAVSDAATSFEGEFPGLIAWRFGEAEARHIDTPVLAVLGGDSDALWPRFGETHRFLLEWLPHAEGFVLPGTTHFLQIQKPHEMAGRLAAFWTEHPLLSI